MMDNFRRMQSFITNNTNADVFSNVMKNTDIYNTLQNMYFSWTEQVKKSTDGTQKSMMEMMNMEQFKGIMDKMFGFDTMEAQKNMMAQMQSAYSNMYNQSTQYNNNMMNTSFNNYNGMMAQPMMQFMQNMFKSLNNNFAPFLKVMTPGKEKEQLELNILIMDKLNEYMTKSTALQMHIYSTGTVAMQQVSDLMMADLQEGKEVKTFQEWHQKWSSLMEESYINLFNSDEYSKLQGELLSLDLDIKASYEKMIEMVMEPYPFILRKQMDEVYLTNYELRKRVRNLEKKVSDLEASNGNVEVAEVEITGTSDESEAKKTSSRTRK